MRAWQAIKTPPPHPMKKRCLSTELHKATAVDDDEEECVEVDSTPASWRLQRATWNKAAKEELHRDRVKESTRRMQAKATSEMAAANAEKVAVMRDQAALQLFSIPDDSTMSNMAREYLQLRNEEELTKVKHRIQQSKAYSFLGPSGGVVESGSIGGAAGEWGELHFAGAGSASASAEEADDGGAEDTSQEYVVRHAGVQDLKIHRPPIPFPFFPPNYQNVWGSFVGSGVGLGSGEGCDRVYAPTSPNLDNFNGNGN
jgi:hypothetical protein